MTPNEDRETVLARGDALWNEFRAALDASLEQPLGPSTDWTGHDVYAHFGRWQSQTIVDLRRLLVGEAPQPVPGTEDEINERWRAEDRSVATEFVRARCFETREDLRDVLATLSTEQWSAFGKDCADDVTEAHLAPHLAMIGK